LAVTGDVASLICASHASNGVMTLDGA